jgi:hypothetical protein
MLMVLFDYHGNGRPGIYCLSLGLPARNPQRYINRYDVRLLLESPTDIPSTPPLHPPSTDTSDPGSPGGWSDLPSDSEDTFFLTPSEVEDYHREKRRRLIERSREERLAALQAEEGHEVEDSWGGSDEEVCWATMSFRKRLFDKDISLTRPS